MVTQELLREDLWGAKDLFSNIKFVTLLSSKGKT
jgi:hypothetical protein